MIIETVSRSKLCYNTTFVHGRSHNFSEKFVIGKEITCFGALKETSYGKADV